MPPKKKSAGFHVQMKALREGATKKAKANAEAAKQVPNTCGCNGCRALKREEAVLMTKDAFNQGGALRGRRAMAAELAAHGTAGAYENGEVPIMSTLEELTKTLVATGAYMLTEPNEKLVLGGSEEVWHCVHVHEGLN